MTAANRAKPNSSVTSDGVTVDLTDPKMFQLVDGDNLQRDLEYTVSVTASPGKEDKAVTITVYSNLLDLTDKRAY